MKFFKILRRGAVAAMAVALMTASQMWAGIVSELPTIRVNGKVMYYYDTQSGDNIYSVAEKLGVSVEEIRAYNPSVSDGVKPRMRLFFPSDIATSKKGDSTGPLTHVVAKGESIYGIARQHGLTMDELISLNPAAANGITTGMRLRLRKDDDAASVAPAKAATSTTLPSRPTAETVTAPANPAVEDTATALPAEVPATSESVEYTYTTTDIAASSDSVALPAREMNVAIILPFLLEEENIGRQTQLYTEFYKGFLLAADTLNLPGRTPVKLHAYDSSASLDTVLSIMRRPEMATMDLIVAPDNLTHLEAIAKSARGALILNVFAVKDSSYVTMPGMIQTNIPHDAMYSHAIEGFIDRFPTATPVFLSRAGGRTDKEEFTDQLKEQLTMAGRDFLSIDFDGYLADADLEHLDPTINSYVFIPMSGSRDEFLRILHALKTFKGRALDSDAVQLFGYPEWATFRGEQFDEICDLTTTIYSRYSPVEHDPDAAAVNDAFRRAYGEGVLDKQMPVLGILGYDTGRMVIEGMRTMAGKDYFPTEFSGIQSGIRLEKSGEEGGLFNNAIFIISYRQGGNIEKTLK